MGRVYAWKLQKINSNNPDTWDEIYAWLAPTGEQTSGDADWDTLNNAKEYAKTLTTIEDYTAAFNRMKANLPYEYLCTGGLKEAADYFYSECEWGGQMGYYGIYPNPGVKITVTPATISGNTETFMCSILAKLVSNITCSIDGGEDIFGPAEKTTKVIQPQVYRYTFPLDSYDYGEHTITATGVDSIEETYEDTTTFTRIDIGPGQPVLYFTPSSSTITATGTTATATLYQENIDAIDIITSGGCTYSVQGDTYTIYFPENTDQSEKTYKLIASSSTLIATYEITQECYPAVHWSTNTITLPSSGGVQNVGFTQGCADNVSVSSNAAFITPTIVGNTVRLACDSTTDERTARITLTGEKGEISVTDILNVTQSGEGPAPTPEGHITLSGDNHIGINGGTLTLTTTTEYALWDNVGVYPSEVSITNISGTGSTGVDVPTAKVTFNVVIPALSGGSGTNSYTDCTHFSLAVKKEGYETKQFVNADKDGTICLEPLSRTIVVNVSATDGDGNIVSDTLTITQN